MYLRTVLELEEEGITPHAGPHRGAAAPLRPTVSQTVSALERDGLLSVAPDRSRSPPPRPRHGRVRDAQAPPGRAAARGRGGTGPRAGARGGLPLGARRMSERVENRLVDLLATQVSPVRDAHSLSAGTPPGLRRPHPPRPAAAAADGGAVRGATAARGGAGRPRADRRRPSSAGILTGSRVTAETTLATSSECGHPCGIGGLPGPRRSHGTGHPGERDRLRARPAGGTVIFPMRGQPRPPVRHAAPHGRSRTVSAGQGCVPDGDGPRGLLLVDHFS
ncbi:hypothetical protein QJS66_09085 [Kocuria rhizophila]|nr:hypothetical protein QJS66_09085 [Kocuria rhizophila]